jgi:predicted MFS family arabinose efflux permease
MKKIILLMTLLLLIVTSFCQITTNSTLSKDYYLNKSKSQKTAAWILLAGGAAVAVGAAILDVSSDWSKSETPYLIALSTGCVSMLGSIPLFIASGKNKRKAMAANAFFKIESTPVFSGYNVVYVSYPAISIKVTLR